MRQNLKRVMAWVLAAAMTTTTIPATAIASDDYYAEAEADQEALLAEEEAARAAEEEAQRAAEEEAARQAEEEAQRAAEEEAARQAEEEAQRAAEEEAARQAEEEAQRASEEEAARQSEEEAAWETEGAESEAETEEETEEILEEETEGERIGGEFKVELENYLITVTTDDEALPAGAELVASFIDEDEYAYGEIKDALAEAYDAEDADAFDKKYSFDAFKVAFVDEDEEEIDPESNVSVTVEVVSEPEDAAEETLRLSSIARDDADNAAVEEITDTFAAGEEAGFELESLGELTVSWESGEVVYTAETDKYLVTVKTKAGALPQDAELQATELEEDTPEFDAAKEALVDDNDEVETVEDFDKAYGFAALDVTFFVDGEEVEPEGAVSVSIKVKELPENASAKQLADSLEISHIKEEEDGTLTVETVASVEEGGNEIVEAVDDPEDENVEIEPGTIQVAEEEAVTVFEVESFSTFALTWEDQSVPVYFVAMTGEHAVDGIFNATSTTSGQQVAGSFVPNSVEIPVQYQGEGDTFGYNTPLELNAQDNFSEGGEAPEYIIEADAAGYKIYELGTRAFTPNKDSADWPTNASAEEYVFAGTFVKHKDESGNETIEQIVDYIWTPDSDATDDIGQGNIYYIVKNGITFAGANKGSFDNVPLKNAECAISDNATHKYPDGYTPDNYFNGTDTLGNGKVYDNGTGLINYDGDYVRVPLAKNDEIFVVYTAKRIAAEAPTVDTVDSKTKTGLHLYQIDFNGNGVDASVGHNYNLSDGSYLADGAVNPGSYSLTLDGNGFPVTTGESGTKAGYSLSSAFEGETEVNKLFIQSYFDKDGTLYFSSDQYFATRNYNGNVYNSDFKVYTDLGTAFHDYKGEARTDWDPMDDGANDMYYYQRGAFMPFNTLDYDTVVARNTWKPDGTRYEGSLANKVIYGMTELNNYYHGMRGHGEFYYFPDGKIDGEPMVFEFTGDDDMVVYIDGMLVLDLGGLHDALNGKIDFSTGKVTWQTNAWAGATNEVEDTIANLIDKAGGEWAPEDYSKHTIDFFYMERGEGASNLKLSIRLPWDVPKIEKTETKVNREDVEIDTMIEPEEGSEDPVLEVFQPVKPGDEITYSIKFKNNIIDPDPLTGVGRANVVITDTIDENVEFDFDYWKANELPNFSSRNVEAVESDFNEETRVLTITLVNVRSAYEDVIPLTVKVKDDVYENEISEVVNSAHGKFRPTKDGPDIELDTHKIENPIPHPTKKEERAANNPAALEDTIEDDAHPEYVTHEYQLVQPGNEIVYTISSKNYKKTDATIIITDTLDPNVEYVYAEPKPDIEPKDDEEKRAAALTWTFTNVKPDDEKTITLGVKVLDDAREVGYVNNQAFSQVGAKNEEGEMIFDTPPIPTDIEENPVPNPTKTETTAAGKPAALETTVENGGNIKGTDLDVYQPVQVGDKIEYKIDYTNYKTQTATVVVSDKLDPNVKFVSADPGEPEGVYDEATRTVTWTLTGVAPRGKDGSKGAVKLTVEVDEGAKAAGKVDNQAKVKVGVENESGQVDKWDPEFPTNEEENPVPSSDKKETKINGTSVEAESTDPGQGTIEGTDLDHFELVKPGDEITYEISTKNYKKSEATVVITDKLDDNVKFVSADPGEPTGVYDEDTHTVTWTFEGVSPEEPENEVQATLVVKVKDSAAQVGYVDNQATTKVGIKNEDQVDVFDDEIPTPEEENPVPKLQKQEQTAAGKPAEVETTVEEGGRNDRDLNVYQAVVPGDEITYELSANNYKSVNGIVVITDPLDENVKFVSATNGGDYDEDTHIVTWTFTNVDAGADVGPVTLTVVVKNEARDAGKVDNQAYVQAAPDADGDGEPDEPLDEPTYTTDEENPVPNPKKEETFAGEEEAEQQGEPVIPEGQDEDYPEYVTNQYQLVNPGDKITYVLTGRNYKKSEATVVITDKLDDNVKFVSADPGEPTGVYDEDTHTVTWTFEGVSPEESKNEVQATLVVEVKESAKEVGKVDNQAKVKVGVKNEDDEDVFDKEYPTDEEENPVPKLSKQEQTAAGEPAELEVRLEGKGRNEADLNVYQAVVPGDEITYELSANNYKSVDGIVVITDELDKNVEFVSASDDGDYDEETGIVTWRFDPVKAGADVGPVTLTVIVQNEAREAGKVDNQAAVKVGNYVDADGDGVPDDEDGDGEPDEEFDDPNYTTDEENPVPNPTKEEKTAANAGAVLESTDDHGEEYPAYETNYYQLVKPGDTISYNLNARNYKKSEATVVITDKLDDNVSFDTASNGGKYDAETHTVTWTFENVASNAEVGPVTLTVIVKESAKEVGKVDNQAKVKVGVKNESGEDVFDKEYPTDEEENPVPKLSKKEQTAAGNPAKLDMTLEGKGRNEADLNVYQPVLPGDEITYQLSANNYKSVDGIVVITDPLDENVTFKSASDGGDYDEDAHTVTWRFDPVAAGADVGPVTLTVIVKEEARDIGRVDNQAAVKVGNYVDADGDGVPDDADGDGEPDEEFDEPNYTTDEENPIPNTVKEEQTAAGESAVLENSEDQGDYATNHYQLVVPGDEISYDVKARNYKRVNATVVITDKLDKNVKFVSATNGGEYDEETHTVTWTFEDVAPDAWAEGSLVVEVKQGAKEVGKVDNQATSKIGVKNESEDVVFDDEYPTDEEENPVPQLYKKETQAAGEAAVLQETQEGKGKLDQDLDIFQPVKPGDKIDYELFAKNYKAAQASVVITDELDPNVKFASASDGGSYDEATHTVTWRFDNVAAAASKKVKLTVIVKESAKEALRVDNQALVKIGVDNNGDGTVDDDEFDPEIPTNEEENPVPDLNKEETQAAGEPAELQGTGEGTAKGTVREIYQPVKVGDQIVYKVSAKNYKKNPATVVITDTLDENVDFVSATAQNGGSVVFEGGVVTWTFENVAPEAEVTGELTVEVLEGAKEAGKVDNQAWVKVGVKNDKGEDVFDEEVPTPEEENPVPDPKKTETSPDKGTGDLGAVRPGQEITYEISYWNYKTEKADVTIVDKLDENVEFVSASNGGTLSDGVVTWTLTDVKADRHGSVKLVVKVLDSALDAGKVENGEGTTVTVGNDKEYNVETVTNPVVEPKKEETKINSTSVTPETTDIGKGTAEGTDLDHYSKVDPGDTITYVITAKNYKGDGATVVITDPLDKNVEFVSASDGGKLSKGVVTWTFKDVPAEEIKEVELVVRVKDSAKKVGKVDNQAFVQCGVDNDGDGKVDLDPPVPTNEEENPIPNPKKEETAPYKGTGKLGNVKVGDVITYSITYKNYTSKTADVVIKDKLDKNVEFVSATNNGKLSSGVVTWTIRNVPAGKGGSVSLKVKVLEGALTSGGGKVVNGGDTTTVKVGDDNAYSVDTVENPVVDQNGGNSQLVLQKRFAGEKISQDAMNNVTFTVKNSKTGKTIGTYTIGKDFTKDANGRYTKVLTVPAGTYVVTESKNTASGYQTSVVYVADGKSTTSSGQVTIADGGKKTVSVTNTYKKSSDKSGSGGSTIGGGSGASPKTGDDTPIALYVTLLALALALVIGAVVYRRKRRA